MINDSKTDWIRLRVAQMPRSRDLVIFVVTKQTDRQTNYFTPAHTHGVIMIVREGVGGLIRETKIPMQELVQGVGGCNCGILLYMENYCGQMSCFELQMYQTRED